MSRKIQIKRGAKANLPVLADGELGYTLDTDQLFVGSGGTNKPLPSSADMSDIAQLSELPNIYITADYLDGWVGKQDERMAQIAFRSPTVNFDAYAKIKPQGTSSLAYPKKNFTIKLYENELYSKKKVSVRPGWGAEDKYVVKADWIDPTHSCNVVSARLAGEMNAEYGIFPNAPNSGCIDGFPVRMHMNGKCVGIYNWNIPKDGWQLGFSGDDEDTALIMCAESQTDSCAFRAAPNFTEWSVEYGKDDADALAALNRVVLFVKDSSDADFRAHFEEYINLDAALNYYCFAYLATAVDNLGKNMLFVTADRNVWFPILYDLDSLWGVFWNGAELLPFDRKCPDSYDCPNSLLWEKLVRCFPNELADRYEELRRGVLSTGSILSAFTKYIYGIPKRAYDEDVEAWPDIENLVRTLDVMREYIPKRAQYTDYMIRRIRTADSNNYGRVLYQLPEPFVGDGVSAYVDTGIRLFDNPQRDWTVIVRFMNAVPEGEKVVCSCFSEIYPNYAGLMVRKPHDAMDNTFEVIVGKNYGLPTPTNPSAYSTVAIVKSLDSYRVFRDGQFVFVLESDPLVEPYMGNLLIGCQESGSFEKMRFSAVTVSNLTVHQRALGDVDVLQLMAALE